MRMRLVALVSAFVVLYFALASRAQQGSGSSVDGVEVLTRGPVHEAYAEAVDASPQATPVINKKPPEPIPEMPPDQKPEGDKVEWMSGYWAWDADRKDYIWVSGFWRTAPPGRAWVPGHWQPVDSDGWQWVPGFWNVAEKAELSYVPAPPAPVEERVVPAPGEGYFYSPGIWVYRDGRYFWRPGTWIAYHEDYVWVPAHYVWTPSGYILVEGYWDHVLQRRGMLFAPVYVSPEVIVRTEFCYVPRHVVCHEFMIGCLFVRPACHHYYYGDYFEARYTDAGYVAFVDYRVGGRFHDPLYGYYVHYPPRRDWDRDTRAVYVGRFHGDIVRPPHSFAEQEKLHVSLTVSVTESDRHGIKTEKITREEVAHAHEIAVAHHEASVQRQRVEADVRSHGVPKQGDPPHVAKFDPKPTSHVDSHTGTSGAVTGSGQPTTHGGIGSQGSGVTSHTGGSTPSGGSRSQGSGVTTHAGGSTPPSGGSSQASGVTTSTGGLTPSGVGSQGSGVTSHIGGAAPSGGGSSQGSGVTTHAGGSTPPGGGSSQASGVTTRTGGLTPSGVGSQGSGVTSNIGGTAPSSGWSSQGPGVTTRIGGSTPSGGGTTLPGSGISSTTGGSLPSVGGTTSPPKGSATLTGGGNVTTFPPGPSTGASTGTGGRPSNGSGSGTRPFGGSRPPQKDPRDKDKKDRPQP
jgi:hypothetical protein